ncbi:hypothetical protein BDR03DRAFT_975183 [Suillus americanus]|nr:hypothetical protein BDR03DRAFT_975183 [Suillus americanus]
MIRFRGTSPKLQTRGLDTSCKTIEVSGTHTECQVVYTMSQWNPSIASSFWQCRRCQAHSSPRAQNFPANDSASLL